MNRFEQQAEQTRRAALRTSLLLWIVGGILLIGALALLGVSGGAPQKFWTGAGIAIAVMLLILRQAGRRLRMGSSRAVKPDERSMLQLDQLPESQSGTSADTRP